MRHLPNLLTLANLFCGCLALVYILNAQPFLFQNPDNGMPDVTYSWAQGVQQLQVGGLLIFLAALFDLLDGFAARALKVFSPIGADLDSLADVVSFGVAPAAILYKLLWDCVSREPNVTDVSLIAMAPAFLIAVFAALRLARFNVTPSTGTGFKGMPVPAVGMLIASFALINWDAPAGWTAWLFGSRWALYGLIALLCYLMVSDIRFLKLLPGKKLKIAALWPQLVLVLVSLIAIPIIKFNTVPLAFLLYIALSFVPQKQEENIEAAAN